MKRLIAYYKNNFFSMFLIGLFVGAVCLALYIILSGIVSENFKFKYKATIMISIVNAGDEVTEKECDDLIKTGDVKEVIKGYLGNYGTYEELLNNYSIKIAEDLLTIEYYNENEDRAKRTVNKLGNVICSELIRSDKIKKYSKIGVTETERIKEYEHNVITRLPITLFTEFGIIAGMALAFIIFNIIYIVNGKIKSEKDIIDELNIMVLANIPHIDELER